MLNEDFPASKEQSRIPREPGCGNGIHGYVPLSLHISCVRQTTPKLQSETRPWPVYRVCLNAWLSPKDALLTLRTHMAGMLQRLPQNSLSSKCQHQSWEPQATVVQGPISVQRLCPRGQGWRQRCSLWIPGKAQVKWVPYSRIQIQETGKHPSGDLINAAIH